MMDFSVAFEVPLMQRSDIYDYIAKWSTKAYFVLLTEDGVVKGFVAYYLNDDLKQLYITLIAVSPGCQGQGVGGRMLEEVEKITQDCGYYSIGLEVAKSNANAHGFYQSHGFAVMEDRGQRYLMRKELAQWAPVVIPTLCRYEHFRRCVESLSRCTHADKTELVIGLDYPAKEEHVEGWQRICDYIPTIKGFKQVTCFRREENYGPARNVIDLYQYAYKTSDTLIATEDDNEFSPCFLDFMNKSLRYYDTHPQVRSVCGYTQQAYYGEASQVIFTHDTSAWGFGLWRHKEKEYMALAEAECTRDLLRSFSRCLRLLRTFPAVLQMFMNMIARGANYGDTKRTILNILNDTYQVKPAVSMVRNWGNDGSGQHCKKVDESFASQPIQVATTFELDAPHQVAMSAHTARAQFYVGLPRPKVLAWMKIVKIAVRYLVFKVKRKR